MRGATCIGDFFMGGGWLQHWDVQSILTPRPFEINEKIQIEDQHQFSYAHLFYQSLPIHVTLPPSRRARQQIWDDQRYPLPSQIKYPTWSKLEFWHKIPNTSQQPVLFSLLCRLTRNGKLVITCMHARKEQKMITKLIFFSKDVCLQKVEIIILNCYNNTQ